ncbi:MAG: 1-acyl-sn-glycerol-3-phosphate acyltransferase [Candidatus Heimdallarchaeota archaeon]|nr:1-acyl-sn-glycerol-3-phosphate acyltransferase [Candidatus Heimdallarchaeota archaeon]
MSEATSDLKYDLIRKTVKLSAYFGYRLEAKGIQNLIANLDIFRGGSIFAGNHESVIDAFLMGLVVPKELKSKRIYFLGKKSALWRNRFWGQLMDYFGVIPVEKRGNQEAVKRGIEVLTRKQALGIFPEGHIRYSRKTLEGKVGVARFAFETESPVIPVGIIGTDGVLPYGGNWPSLGKKVSLAVGEPIFLADWYDKKDMYDPYALRAATDLVMNHIRKLSSGYGIRVEDAYKLRCMEGVHQIVTPRRLVPIEFQRKRKTLADSFEDWLGSVPQTQHEKQINKSKDKFPEVQSASGNTTNEFLAWLDDQL